MSIFRGCRVLLRVLRQSTDDYLLTANSRTANSLTVNSRTFKSRTASLRTVNSRTVNLLTVNLHTIINEHLTHGWSFFQIMPRYQVIIIFCLYPLLIENTHFVLYHRCCIGSHSSNLTCCCCLTAILLK